MITTGVEANPSSTTVDALNDVTLTCQTSSPLIMPSQYSWFRINGDIPSSSSGQNTNTLTLRNVVSADEGEYYCIAALSRHCARSNNVMVSVRGKRNVLCAVKFSMGLLEGIC